MAKTQIFKDYQSFSKREDKAINGIDADFAKKYGIDLDADNKNIGCWNCVSCVSCEYCANCTNCTNCKYCDNCLDCLDCLRCVGFVGKLCEIKKGDLK